MKDLSETNDSSRIIPIEAAKPDILAATLISSNYLMFPTKGRKDVFIDLVKQSLDMSIRTWSPKFLDKLYAAACPIGIIAELIIALLNTNVHVYHVSPVFSVVEVHALKQLGVEFGLKNAGGAFCPGGAYSNIHAMVTARNVMFPQMIMNGVLELESSAESKFTPVTPQAADDISDELKDVLPYRHESNKGPLVVFTSAHSHFSVTKAAITLGIGLNHVRAVPVKHDGCMDVRLLEKMVQQSVMNKERPFFVNATAGTTVRGAFDELDEISVICKKFGLWLHVDGSWGGAAIFSSQHKDLLRGSEKAHSITMNPHKLLGVPLICSALIMRDSTVMQRVNSVTAKYLFHDRNEYDVGRGTIGCGRKPDAFKFFLCWNYYGREGFTKRVDKAFENSRYLAESLRQQQKFKGSFELISDKVPFLNVCFWYYPPLECIPTNVRAKVSSCKDSRELFEKLKVREPCLYTSTLTAITNSIHRKLDAEGQFMVDYAHVEVPGTLTNETTPYFWRVVFNSPAVEPHHIDTLLESIDALGSVVVLN